MRLYYIADTELPSQNANGVNIIKMSEALAAHFETELIIPTFSSNPPSVDDVRAYYDVHDKFAIKFIRVWKVPGALILYAILVAVYCLRNLKNVNCFFYGRSPFGLALLAMFGYPVALDMHGKIWQRGIWRKWSISFLTKSAATKFLTFNSEPLKSSFLKDYSRTLTGGKPVLAMPNGATPVSREQKFEFYGNSALRVGYVGSFHEGRGVELIIELAARLPHIEFHLAGGPSDLSRELAKARKARNVYFYDHLPFRETAAFRKGCDILIAPYQANVKVPSGEITVEYMSPIKIFEYMSSKRPIICSDFPVLRPILNDRNSILVPANDIAAWESAVLKLQNEDLRSYLSENAFNDFQKNYTWDARAQKVKNLIVD